MEKLISALFVAVTALSSTSALAGTLVTGSDDVCQIQFSGNIVNGDAEALSRAIDEQGVGSLHDIKLCLDSPGGSLAEGIRIGQLIYDRGIPTRLKPDARCLSACAIAFMMGNTYGDHDPGDGSNADRRMHTSSILGFHRPALSPSVADKRDSARLGQAFDVAIEASLEFLVLANFGSYRETMIPSDLVQSMFAHRGEDYFYIDTVGKAGRWHIGIDGVRWPDAIDKKAALHACDNLGEWQFRYSENALEFTDAESQVEILTREGNEIVLVVSGNHLTESDGNQCLVRLIVSDEAEPYLEVCGKFPSEERFVGGGECGTIAAADPSIERWKSPMEIVSPRFEMGVILDPSTPLSETQKAADVVQQAGRAMATAAHSPTASLRSRCGKLEMSVRIHGVNSFTNLRSQPGLDSDVVGQANLHETVTPTTGPVRFWNTQAGDVCENLCEFRLVGSLVTLNGGHQYLQAISQCYEANRYWYEVEIENGQTGFVSGKFLRY